MVGIGLGDAVALARRLLGRSVELGGFELGRSADCLLGGAGRWDRAGDGCFAFSGTRNWTVVADDVKVTLSTSRH
jgi:hypothetical protein